jgi:PAS domain S-box-containing protein
MRFAMSSPLLRYGLAVFIVIVATLLRFLFSSLLGEGAPFILYFPAVALTAWLVGFGPSLLTTLLCALAAWFFFISPAVGLSNTHLVQVFLFALGSAFISALTAALNRSEQKEREKRMQFQVTLASIGDGVIVTDAEGRVTFMNGVAEQLTGWQLQDATDKPLTEVFHIVNEHTREATKNPALRAIREGLIVGLANHTILIAKDGTEIPIDDSGAPVWVEGERLLGAVLVFRDITQRRVQEKERDEFLAREQAARERLANIVASVPGVVWEAWGEPNAAAQRIDFVSHYVEEMLGYSVEEWLSTPNFWATIVHPEDKESALRVAAEHFNGGGGVNQFRWVTKDGRAIFVEGYAAVIRDDEGRPIGMRGVTLDVTERARLREERERLLELEHQARVEAEEASRLKDEFLATVSHEVRTPLNAILGYARMLRAGRLKGEAAERAVEIIERNATAQAQLIEDLLDVSRIITGKMRLELRPVEISAVIESALESVRPAAAAKEIHLQTIFSSETGLILGDAARLQQVVWNLLSNAIKFTPKGGRVQVILQRLDSQIEIIVRDKGRGIKADFLPYVFERFRQADGTTTRLAGGLGLGLAIVRHLVELHGGNVMAESEGEGQGATFTVRLPIMAVAADSGLPTGHWSEAANEMHPTRERSPLLTGIKILVVEDEASARSLLASILEDCQAEVRTVASAAEGAQEFEAWRPDVLISDIGMPMEDGYAFIKKIRARETGRRTPAIALTAYARSEDRLRALAAGFQMHVSKPVDPTELVLVVKSLLTSYDGEKLGN